MRALDKANELAEADPLFYVDALSIIENEIHSRKAKAAQRLQLGRKFDFECQVFLYLDGEMMMYCPARPDGLPDLMQEAPVDTWNIDEPERYQRDLEELQRLPAPFKLVYSND